MKLFDFFFSLQKEDVIFHLIFAFSVYQDKAHYLLWPRLFSWKQLQTGKSDRSNNKWKVPQECVFIVGAGNDLGCWLLPLLFPGFVQWVTLTLQHSETNTLISQPDEQVCGQGTPLSNESSGVGLGAESWAAGNVLWAGWNSQLWLCWGHRAWWLPKSGSGQPSKLKEELNHTVWCSSPAGHGDLFPCTGIKGMSEPTPLNFHFMKWNLLLQRQEKGFGPVH